MGVIAKGERYSAWIKVKRERGGTIEQGENAKKVRHEYLRIHREEKHLCDAGVSIPDPVHPTQLFTFPT